MTEDQLLELDKLGIEWPDQTAPWEEQKPYIAELQKTLSSLLGLDLEIDEAQDATFTFQLRHDVPSILDNNRSECVIAFTFSNFGKLVLIWGNKDLNWEQTNQNLMIPAYEILEKKGYIIVRDDIFSRPYTGIHSYWVEKTWGDRFFSWY